jgi:hypothetical protein
MVGIKIINLFMLCVLLSVFGGCAHRQAQAGGGESASVIDWDVFLAEMRAERSRSQPERVHAPDSPVAEFPPLPEEIAAVAAGVVTIQPDSVVQVTVREDSKLDGSYQVNQLSAIQLGVCRARCFCTT